MPIFNGRYSATEPAGTGVEEQAAAFADAVLPGAPTPLTQHYLMFDRYRRPSTRMYK